MTPLVEARGIEPLSTHIKQHSSTSLVYLKNLMSYQKINKTDTTRAEFVTAR